MGEQIENLFAEIDTAEPDEVFETLLSRPGFRLERIISHGHATPEGEWYNQPQDEWVALLAGSAGLLIRGEVQPRTMKPGDYVYLPAHCEHRIEWTASGEHTVWLALHFFVGHES